MDTALYVPFTPQKKLANAIASFVYLSIGFIGLYHAMRIGGAYPGLTPRANLFDYALAPVMVMGAVALWIPRGPREIFLVGVPFYAFVQGLMLSEGGAGEGRWILGLSVVAGLLTARAHLPSVMRRVEDAGKDQPHLRRAA